MIEIEPGPFDIAVSCHFCVTAQTFKHMPGPLLYSTNPLIKLLIHERYRGDRHYVWCSEDFDCTKLPTYTASALGAPSSNPSEIYRQLKAECSRGERHSVRIPQMKAVLSALAVQWASAGEITDAQKQDIIYQVDTADLKVWRPIIYVIPKAPLAATPGRLQSVPAAKCASFAPEFIIQDLHRSEFDIIELD